MNTGMKARQFVNLVTEKCSGSSLRRAEPIAVGSYSLRRVKASDLSSTDPQKKHC
jgi:hypothetical protein